MTKRVTIAEFLTGDQIGEALAIWRRNPSPAQEIADKIIAPNLSAINLKLGQENDPMFLAYAVEHVFNETQTRLR